MYTTVSVSRNSTYDKYEGIGTDCEELTLVTGFAREWSRMSHMGLD